MRLMTTTHFTVATLFGAVLCSAGLSAQEDPDAADAEAAETDGVPEIPDEPRTIDPARFLPESLAAPVTVDFTDSTLSEVADWIRDEHQFPVLIDERSLADSGILLSDPVNDRLDGDPVYLLLERLRSMNLAWYVQDDILWITTAEVAEEELTTEQYLVGDLFDAGYEEGRLIDVIANETSGPWFDLDGIGGSIELLGDVLFVRQTDRVQLEVRGLLAALRDHARMTFILDPPQHMSLREKLEQDVTADFDDAPLVSAVENLAGQADAAIRIDTAALEARGVRERQPVSLELADRPLGTVLELLLSKVRLTYMLRDGVIWITTVAIAEDSQKTAVYDVRDLCRDFNESDALLEAIQEQTRGPWFDLDGVGGTITFARPGVMVVRHNERRLFEVLELLETYRAALRASKPRDRDAIDPQEVITRYYRMPDAVADDLERLLPQLVRPESWKSDERVEAAGTILQASSGDELRGAEGFTVIPDSAAAEQRARHALVVPQSVLIITQTREIHDEIAEVIERVQQGDAVPAGEQGFSGGGFGGGGFGSGFFSTE